MAANAASRTRLAALAYALVVGILAAVGFQTQSSWPVLLAVVLTLPASVVTAPGYYVLYGLLSQIPGANPAHNSGTSDGAGIVTSGVPAPWFMPTVHVLGVALLALGAVLNVLVVRLYLARRHATESSPVTGA